LDASQVPSVRYQYEHSVTTVSTQYCHSMLVILQLERIS